MDSSQYGSNISPLAAANTRRECIVQTQDRPRQAELSQKRRLIAAKSPNAMTWS